MMTGRSAVLLIGSPKRPRSTSRALGTYLLERLCAKGFATQSFFTYRFQQSEDQVAAMLEALDGADLIVLAFPNYYDSLPAGTIRALERIAENRLTTGSEKAQQFLAIANGGFPEAHQIDGALAICRRFAEETGLAWAGGLALGGGEAVNGVPLKEKGGMVRNVVRSLDLTAEALAAGRPVPSEAVDLMARPLIPGFLYLLFGSFGWKRRARKFGMQKRLGDRPLQS